MGVKIRLQNHGCKNHNFWWIVVQGMETNPKGRILEKIGMWWPRNTARYKRSIVINRQRIKYWIGVGAVPSPGAHRVLAQAELIPRITIPLGSSSLYKKPDKLHPQAFRKYDIKTPVLDTYNRMSMKSLATTELAQLSYHARLNAEALQSGALKDEDLASGGMEYVDDILNVEKYMPSLEGVHTSDIDSDEADFLTRKRNFEELRRRMEQNRSESELMHFKDYKYNMYARKMKKLVQIENGIDTQGYFELMKAAREIAKKEKEALDAQSKPPRNDRQHSYNQESFGGLDSWVESAYSKLDEDFTDMREREYRENMRRFKEYHFLKHKLKDSNYKRDQLIDPVFDQNFKLDRFGKYPPGFDHFENGEKYMLKFPERTLAHYHAHMNRDCTFYEFVEIMVSARLEDIRYEIVARKEEESKHEDVYNPLLPEQKTRIVNEIFDDPEAREELMGQFSTYQRLSNQNGGTFTFIDCLEMFAHIFDVPLRGSLGERLDRDTDFFPTRKGLPPPPRMDQDEQSFNVSRLGPTTLEYPFKAYTAPNRYMVRPLRVKKLPISFSKNGRYYTKYARYRGAHKWHPKEP